MSDSGQSPGNRAGDFERRQRELEQLRENIERVRRARAESLEQFTALTKRKDEPRPAGGDEAGAVPVRDTTPDAPQVPPRVAAPAAPATTEAEAPSAPPPVSAPQASAPPVSAQPVSARPETAPPGSAPAAEPEVARPPTVAAAPETVAAPATTPQPQVTNAPAAAPPAADLPSASPDIAGIDAAAFEEPIAAPPRQPWGLWAALALLALAGVAAYFLWGRPPREAAPEPAATTPADEVAPAPPPASAPAAAPAPRPPLTVELATLRPVWIRSVVDANEPVERMLGEGRRLRFEAERALVLRVGDAGAVRVTVNGEDRGLVGRDGQVVTTRFDAPGTANR